MTTDQLITLQVNQEDFIKLKAQADKLRLSLSDAIHFLLLSKDVVFPKLNLDEILPEDYARLKQQTEKANMSIGQLIHNFLAMIDHIESMQIAKDKLQQKIQHLEKTLDDIVCENNELEAKLDSLIFDSPLKITIPPKDEYMPITEIAKYFKTNAQKPLISKTKCTLKTCKNCPNIFNQGCRHS